MRVRLRDDPTPIAGDLLVGADGLHSVVRRHVLGDGPPRYAGETIFRGIADLALPRPEICRELFGAGRRAAYYELGGGRVYWWATAPLPAGTEVPRAGRRAYLLEAFAGWAFDLPDVLAATPDDRILQNDIYDRPPARRWHRGRVVLLGDAAHPTTPNLGQGACMAIEDAVVLARALVEARDAATGVRALYRRARSAAPPRSCACRAGWGASASGSTRRSSRCATPSTAALPNPGSNARCASNTNTTRARCRSRVAATIARRGPS